MATVEALVDEVGKLGDAEKTQFMTDFVGKQSVLWLSGAVKALEEKFGVKAASGGGGGGGPAPVAVAEKAEEKTTFDVILKSGGPNKINAIKAVRAMTSLGLKEAKDLVDKGNTPVKTGVPKDEAEKALKELKDAGADAEIK